MGRRSMTMPRSMDATLTIIRIIQMPPQLQVKPLQLLKLPQQRLKKKHQLKLHGFVNLRQVNLPFTGRIGIKIKKAVIPSAASKTPSNSVKST